MPSIKSLTYSFLSTAAISLPSLAPAYAQQYNYPTDVVHSFMDLCVEKSGKQDMCACVLDKIDDQYSVEEYLQIEAEVKSKGKIPNEVKTLMYSCLTPRKISDD